MSCGSSRTVLVIGYGNSLRRDDGAGLFLAQQLVSVWLKDSLPASLISAHQLDPELADDIDSLEAEIVLFIDAAVPSMDGEPSIELHPLNLQPDAPSIGHHLTPTAVMLYATQLYNFDGVAWLLGVPGFDFDHGEGLSVKCVALVRDCVQNADAIWNTLQSADQLSH